MIEAVMFWNEPNNQSHWDFEVDPDWRIFAEMVKLAGDAVAAENSQLIRVLGGISPIDANFIQNMQGQGVLEHLDESFFEKTATLAGDLVALPRSALNSAPAFGDETGFDTKRLEAVTKAAVHPWHREPHG